MDIRGVPSSKECLNLHILGEAQGGAQCSKTACDAEIRHFHFNCFFSKPPPCVNQLRNGPPRASSGILGHPRAPSGLALGHPWPSLGNLGHPRASSGTLGHPQAPSSILGTGPRASLGILGHPHAQYIEVKIMPSVVYCNNTVLAPKIQISRQKNQFFSKNLVI